MQYMEKTSFIEQVTQRISELGLTTPAILLLEAHKPLAFLGSQLLFIAQPAMDIFAPPNLIGNLADLLANDSQLEQLITMLEKSATKKEKI